MRRAASVFVLVALASVVLALAGAPRRAESQGPPPGGPGGQGGPGRPPGMLSMPPDSFAADRDSLIKLVLERIQGRENAPAESVFKNIKVLKGLPAARLLRTMNAFGHSLGVPCSHCHVENHWADEDKPAKQLARDMMAMAGALNDTLLARIKFPHDEHPHVGCFTCHRGHADPNFGMGRGPGGPRPGGPNSPGGQQQPGGDRH